MFRINEKVNVEQHINKMICILNALRIWTNMLYQILFVHFSWSPHVMTQQSGIKIKSLRWFDLCILNWEWSEVIRRSVSGEQLWLKVRGGGKGCLKEDNLTLKSVCEQNRVTVNGKGCSYLRGLKTIFLYSWKMKSFWLNVVC